MLRERERETFELHWSKGKAAMKNFWSGQRVSLSSSLFIMNMTNYTYFSRYNLWVFSLSLSLLSPEEEFSLLKKMWELSEKWMLWKGKSFSVVAGKKFPPSFNLIFMCDEGTVQRGGDEGQILMKNFCRVPFSISVSHYKIDVLLIMWAFDYCLISLLHNMYHIFHCYSPYTHITHVTNNINDTRCCIIWRYLSEKDHQKVDNIKNSLNYFIVM